MDYTFLSKCDGCTLQGSSGRKVLPQVPLDQQYPCLFIGQAPGKTEVVTGIPFTGAAGKMMYACMRQAVMDKRRFPITNLVPCLPPSDAKGNDRAPTPREIQNCHLRLKHEIHEFKPKLIVALGGPASYELTGKENIQSLRGQYFPLRDKFEYECSVLCMLHPSFVMRQRAWVNQAVDDFKMIHKFFFEGLPPQEADFEFLLDPSAQELDEYLSRSEVFAFDTETTGLNVRKDKVLGMSFSNSKTTACAFYLQRPYDPRLEVAKRYLEDPAYKKVTQNGSYDCEIIFNDLAIVVR